MFTLKLMEYNQFLNRKYLETISKLSWEEVIKDRSASFSSFRDIFLHVLAVTDAYISTISEGVSNYQDLDFNEYDSIEKITAYLEQVETKVSAYLSKVTPEELSRKMEIKRRDGSTIEIPVEQMLLDLFQEDTHHRGEFIALLWQLKVEPPHMGFSKYILTQNR
jgi:uncharacterized damage-inducible protein DinB